LPDEFASRIRQPRGRSCPRDGWCEDQRYGDCRYSKTRQHDRLLVLSLVSISAIVPESRAPRKLLSVDHYSGRCRPGRAATRRARHGRASR